MQMFNDYISVYREIVDFRESNWINQRLTIGLVIIFRFLLTELHQTKHFGFFHFLAIEEKNKLMENVKRYKGRESR